MGLKLTSNKSLGGNAVMGDLRLGSESPRVTLLKPSE